MAKKKKAATVSDQLKQAIVSSGKTCYEIAKESGVSESALSRFLSGKRSLKLVSVDRLCQVLGIELQKISGQQG